MKTSWRSSGRGGPLYESLQRDGNDVSVFKKISFINFFDYFDFLSESLYFVKEMISEIYDRPVSKNGQTAP